MQPFLRKICDGSWARGFPPKAPRITRPQRRGSVRQHVLFLSHTQQTARLRLCSLGSTSSSAALLYEQHRLLTDCQSVRAAGQIGDSCHMSPPPNLGRGSIRPNLLPPPMRAWAEEGALGNRAWEEGALEEGALGDRAREEGALGNRGQDVGALWDRAQDEGALRSTGTGIWD